MLEYSIQPQYFQQLIQLVSVSQDPLNLTKLGVVFAYGINPGPFINITLKILISGSLLSDSLNVYFNQTFSRRPITTNTDTLD